MPLDKSAYLILVYLITTDLFRKVLDHLTR